jgi:hypothetical protein
VFIVQDFAQMVRRSKMVLWFFAVYFYCSKERTMNKRAFLAVRILSALALLLAVPGVEGSAGAANAPVTNASLSQAAPCEPPGGVIIDSMENAGFWTPLTGNGAVSAAFSSVPGYQGQAIQLNYDLGSTTGAYAQLRRDFATPLDLSAADHLRFFFKGTAANTLEVGLVSDAGENYFATGWSHVTHVGWWAQGIWDLRDFRKDGQALPDLSKVRAIFISVVKGPGDTGGSGSFVVDEITALTGASRSVPSAYEYISASPTTAQVALRAADWIYNRQQVSGLVKSWKEDGVSSAWLYDQALALLVLMETHPDAAQKLYAQLHALHNNDGSWYEGYNSETLASLNSKRPVGAISWLVYALARYGLKTGNSDAYQDAREGAAWLASLQRSDGSLPGQAGDTGGAPTEPNLDAWWAFQIAGYSNQAGKLDAYLLNDAWDSSMKRFLAGPDDYQIFLDNQTWGAAFLRFGVSSLDGNHMARQALSYACQALATHSSDGSISGFDGGGPFSVWNEGTLQYIAAHGQGSQYYFEQMTKQQADDGGMPGSPDSFTGYIVWLTQWHGVAPTAWLYFAATGGPFGIRSLYLPVIIR